MPHAAILGRELGEKRGCTRCGIASAVIRLRVRSGQHVPREYRQTRHVIDVVPLGERRDRHTDFGSAHGRLPIDAFGAPVDRLEQPLMKLLRTDQVLAAVDCRAEDNPVARLM